MPISHQGVFHRRPLFEEHGGFDPSFRFAGDYDLLLRELRNAEALFMPDMVIAMHRSGGLSGSAGNEVLVLRELRRAQKAQGLAWPPAAWLVRYVAAWLHRALRWSLGARTGTAIIDALRRLAGKKAHWSRIR
jgi:hypothetical protein